MSQRRPLPFEVIPAIDLRGGRCVRLFQGSYEREKVYSDDPSSTARRWQELGARRLHVVDLDGARSGDQANAEAVRAIVDSVSLPVQLGGGMRDFATVARWLDVGIDRVFLGTAAVQEPQLVVDVCRRFPGHIGAGADAREGRIAVRGWEEESGQSVESFVRRMLESGVAAISYTNISLDGTLAGPDLLGIRRLIDAIGPFAAELLLAGGIASLEDVLEAAQVEGLSGVIVGRALYEGSLDLGDAINALARSEET